MRFDIDGHSRVVLFAKRKIKAGEILYYDYNAGGFDEYPTENFIWNNQPDFTINININY